MTGITFAGTYGAVNKGLALQVGVAIVIKTGLVLHIDHRRAFGVGKQRHNNDA